MINILISFLYVASSAYAQTVYFRDEESSIHLGNSFIEVGFNKNDGGISSVFHRDSGVDLRGFGEEPAGALWDIIFVDDELLYHGTNSIASQDYYEGCHISETLDEVEITFEWSSIWLYDYEYPARVSASIRISENSRFAKFSLEIENYGSAAIEAINYPRILHVSGLGENYADDNLVVPSQNGSLIHNLTENLVRCASIYPSGFQNMQFIAYYDDDTGFYFATYDENANTKSISWIRDESRNISIEFTHLPIFDYGSSSVLEYDVIIGAFNGDWYSAAERARFLLMFTPPDEIPPKAKAGPDIIVPEDTTVIFNGSGSTDNQEIVDYTWTFKDRNEKITLKDVYPSYNFTSPGSYFVTLNVTDAMNNFDIDIFEIYVMDTTKPVAQAGPDRIAKVGENIIFDASQSIDNVRILSYEWDFGDGINRTFPIEIHTYTETGIYEVTLTVKDWVGNIATDTVKVTVEEKLPGTSIETHGFLSWISTGVKLILILVGISFAIFMIPFILLTRSSTRSKNIRKRKRLN